MKTKDDEILTFITRFIESNGYPPTVREIGGAVGLSSTASVSDRLDKLEAAGRLKVSRGIARGIRVTEGRSDGERDAAGT